MKKAVLNALILFPLVTSSHAADDFALSFGPAPANLSTQESGFSLGYDVVNDREYHIRCVSEEVVRFKIHENTLLQFEYRVRLL